ncbi:MAG: response regulator, partial [Bradyrhizobium sp.]|nr:response regulator [Bradyrhizobium sp.]
MSGLKVLLVEDEATVRTAIADMLRAMGHSIAAEAGHMREAMAFARSGEFDLAVLDLNVGGQMIFPVADLIQTRGVPFIFMTGYGQGISPKRFQDRPA